MHKLLSNELNDIASYKKKNELKKQIREAIHRYSEQGFVPCNGCNLVCDEMMVVLQQAKSSNQAQALDILLMVFTEAVKLFFHADVSSGAPSNVIRTCLSEIDKLCKVVDEKNKKYFFESIVNSCKIKTFSVWPDYGYRLLKYAAVFISEHSEAQNIYEVFDILGAMPDGKEYPDKLLIKLSIILRLEGKAAADTYIKENLGVPQIRIIAVANSIAEKQYAIAEKLCIEALKKSSGRKIERPAIWAYYLENLYQKTSNEDKLNEIVRYILFNGDMTYFKKLKELCQIQGTWEKDKNKVLFELSETMDTFKYSALLAREGEFRALLEVIKKHKSYIMCYGKLLAEIYRDEVYRIYEEYLYEEVDQYVKKNDYTYICSIIEQLYNLGARIEAVDIIERLSIKFQENKAMIKEITRLKTKICN